MKTPFIYETDDYQEFEFIQNTLLDIVNNKQLQCIDLSDLSKTSKYKAIFFLPNDKFDIDNMS